MQDEWKEKSLLDFLFRIAAESVNESGACLCQRRRSRGACRTIACPPTLSGVNCKRDRVAVDLPVPWRCRKGGCQRRRSRGACRTIACPPRRCRGLTASETALRSICLSLGVVGRVAASGDAHAAYQGALLHLLHSAADTQSHAETTWRTISSRANPQSSLSEMNLVKLDGFGYIPAFNNTPLTEALQEQAKIHINRQINTPAQLRADYRAARKC